MSSHTKQNKRTKIQKNLRQYYADDMIEDEENEIKKSVHKKTKNALQEEEDEENDEECVNLDDAENKKQLQNKDMDWIAGIVVTLLHKNKLNPKNAFDVPLPDVQQLSDFQLMKGDGSWKKMSQTLDAGAKIYGMRVDSTHNEAYRVLGGLNRTELAEAVPDFRRADEEDHCDSPIHGIENGQKKPRKDNGGYYTLEKNPANLDADKYDLEFDVDPLFQKTSAQFDEAGAKGLLFNNLNIDAQLNLMLDSSVMIEADDGSASSSSSSDQRRLKLCKRYFSLSLIGHDNFFSRKICPELTKFKQTYLKDSTEFGSDLDQIDKIPVIMKAKDFNGTIELKFENIDVDADRMLYDLGRIVDGDFDDPNDNVSVFEIPRPSIWREQQEDFEAPNQNGFEIKDEALNFANISERLSILGLGEDLDKFMLERCNWMGPESWKIQPAKKRMTKNKQVSDKSDKGAKKRKWKEVWVDFDLSEKENWKDVFAVASNVRRNDNPKAPTKGSVVNEVKQKYLLPIDLQIRPSRLGNLFSRGINHEQNEDLTQLNINKANKYFMNLDANEQSFHNGQTDFYIKTEIQQDLSYIFTKASKEGFESDKFERSINIRVLKENIWEYIEDKLPVLPQDELFKTKKDISYSNGTNLSTFKKREKNKFRPSKLVFSDIYGQLPKIVSNQDVGAISVHSCFVTMLHLANEKDLAFINNNNYDFEVFREP